MQNTIDHTGNMGQKGITQKRYADEDPADAHIKNLKGELGPICSYCAGLGFTNTITGGSAGCMRCMQTGIEPVNTYELAKKVDELTELVRELIAKK